jgi:hypothetical protein
MYATRASTDPKLNELPSSYRFDPRRHRRITGLFDLWLGPGPRGGLVLPAQPDRSLNARALTELIHRSGEAANDVRILANDGARHAELFSEVAGLLGHDVLVSPDGTDVRHHAVRGSNGPMHAVPLDRRTHRAMDWLVIQPPDLATPLPGWFAVDRGLVGPRKGVVGLPLRDGLVLACRADFVTRRATAHRLDAAPEQLLTVVVTARAGGFMVSDYGGTQRLYSGGQLAAVLGDLPLYNSDLRLWLAWPSDPDEQQSLAVQVRELAETTGATVWTPPVGGRAELVDDRRDLRALDQAGEAVEWQAHRSRFAGGRRALRATPNGLLAPALVRESIAVHHRLAPAALPAPAASPLALPPPVSLPPTSSPPAPAPPAPSPPAPAPPAPSPSTPAPAPPAPSPPAPPVPAGPAHARPSPASAMPAGPAPARPVRAAPPAPAPRISPAHALAPAAQSAPVLMPTEPPGPVPPRPELPPSARAGRHGLAESRHGLADEQRKATARPERPRWSAVGRAVAQRSVIEPAAALTAAAGPEAARPATAELVATRPATTEAEAARPATAELVATQPASAELVATRPFAAKLEAAWLSAAARERLTDPPGGTVGPFPRPALVVEERGASAYGPAWLSPRQQVNAEEFEAFIVSPVDPWSLADGIPSAELFLVAYLDLKLIPDGSWVLRVRVRPGGAIPMVALHARMPARLQHLYGISGAYLLPAARLNQVVMLGAFRLDAGHLTPVDEFAGDQLRIRSLAATGSIAGLPQEIRRWPAFGHRRAYALLPAGTSRLPRGWLRLYRRPPQPQSGRLLLELRVPRDRAIDVAATAEALAPLARVHTQAERLRTARVELILASRSYGRVSLRKAYRVDGGTWRRVPRVLGGPLPAVLPWLQSSGLT